MPHGRSSWPSPSPGSPMTPSETPLGVKRCTRWLCESDTYTVSFAPTAMPEGPSNSPSPLPVLPHFAKNLPSRSNTVTRLSYSSAM